MTEAAALDQLHADWNAFKARHNRPAELIAEEFRPAALDTRVWTVDEPAAVRAAIAEFGGEQGWLTLTDRHVLLQELQPAGIILNGELCKAGESLHIRHQGGRWLLAYHREIAGAAPTHLACERRFASHASEQSELAYSIYYQATPDRGTQPAVARFIGFMEASA